MELLNEEVEDSRTELQQVEDELRTLKPLYQEAKALGDKETRRTHTHSTSTHEQAQGPETRFTNRSNRSLTAEASDEDGDSLFAEFVAIVDNLLGDHLPENIVNDFVASPEFDTYRSVLGSLKRPTRKPGHCFTTWWTTNSVTCLQNQFLHS